MNTFTDVLDNVGLDKLISENCVTIWHEDTELDRIWFVSTKQYFVTRKWCL